MKRKLLLLLTYILGACSCTQAMLVKDASAAYQYQKELYQHECPLPPKPRSEECVARDAKLTEDFKYVNAALVATDVSKGGKLPPAAIKKLKEVKADLSK